MTVHQSQRILNAFESHVAANSSRTSTGFRVRIFNDNKQTSFKQYLAQLRVIEAKALLLQLPPKPLELVAEEAGFQSMSTFHAAFKKLEGLPPGAFRAAAGNS